MDPAKQNNLKCSILNIYMTNVGGEWTSNLTDNLSSWMFRDIN